ncbi:helix-turn-helix domain-containing protein [Acinetobacter sp. CUI P1]|nr:helix-turn-helix domain-containing protein [Acinetobacter sp. CUI P1]
MLTSDERELLKNELMNEMREEQRNFLREKLRAEMQLSNLTSSSSVKKKKGKTTKMIVEELSEEELLERSRTQTSFGRYLEQLRISHGLSLRDAMKLTGLSHSYIAKLEKGSTRKTDRIDGGVSSDALRKLAHAYQVPEEEMFIMAGYTVGDSVVKTEEPQIFNERIKKFGERLTELVNQSVLPLEFISLKTNITDIKLNELMNGKARPRLEDVYSLAPIFEVTPDYLYGYVDETNGYHTEMPKLPDLIDFITSNSFQAFGKPMSASDKEKIVSLLMNVLEDSHQRAADEESNE